MTILNYAKERIIERGKQYYKDNAVFDLKAIDDYTYQAKVSGAQTYTVTYNIFKPKLSTCTCPHF